MTASPGHFADNKARQQATGKAEGNKVAGQS
jgi:hypothetical protein